MSIKVDIPSYLQPYTTNMEVVEVEGNTVSECLDYLIKQFPDMGKMLFSDGGQLLEYAGIFVNGEDTYPEELAKTVKDGDILQVIYIIGGG